MNVQIVILRYLDWNPRRDVGIRAFTPIRFSAKILLMPSKNSSNEQTQDGLIGLIGLSKHGRAGLLQDVQASQVGAL